MRHVTHRHRHLDGTIPYVGESRASDEERPETQPGAGLSRRRLVALGLGSLAGITTFDLGRSMPASARTEPRPDEPVGVPWGHPFPRQGRVTQEFGPRSSGVGIHYGTDYAGPPNYRDPIYSVAPGIVVTRVMGHPGWGNYVKIDHGRAGGHTWASLYAHMDWEPEVFVGQIVPDARRLGIMGSTGNSTGPHLHLEIHRDGVPVDPRPRVHDGHLVGTHGRVIRGDDPLTREDDTMWIAERAGDRKRFLFREGAKVEQVDAAFFETAMASGVRIVRDVDDAQLASFRKWWNNTMVADPPA